ncbi:MAG: urease accessory protein [Nonomuraea sp.]|nr:urease accessory protein [Nonomuraea sp.]
MNPSLLLLTDSRLPAGGHAHSGGTEQAIASGAVHDLPTLASFLRGRLHTTGALTATLTATAHTQATHTRPEPIPNARDARAAHRSEGVSDTRRSEGVSDTRRSEGVWDAPRPEGVWDAPRPEGVWDAPRPEGVWDVLDAEVDARTASPAQRDASRTQGRLLLRVARRVWPSPVLDDLAQATPNPHHPVALGAVAYAAGATMEEAAMAAAYHAISGPATAAVRLLGLDPVAVHALLATLTPDLTTIATKAATAAAAPTTDVEAAGAVDFDAAALPAWSAPALDLLAEQHAGARIRLFVS